MQVTETEEYRQLASDEIQANKNAISRLEKDKGWLLFQLSQLDLMLSTGIYQNYLRAIKEKRGEKIKPEDSIWKL